MNTSVFVIFKKELSSQERHVLFTTKVPHVVVASESLRKCVEDQGCTWVDLDSFCDPGNIYEASAFVQELSQLTLIDGTPVTKACVYKGYELWWIHYSDIFLYMCLPYTQYKRLLTFLREFNEVYFYDSPYRDLFSSYLLAYERTVHLLYTPESRRPRVVPLGLVLQAMLTLISIPIAVILRQKVLIFTGDKFDGKNDYDARLRFVYEELRMRRIPFIEFVRSLESGKVLIAHALRRRRPVLYSAGLALFAKVIAWLSWSHYYKDLFNENSFDSISDPERRFRLRTATTHLRNADEDIWGIRLNAFLLTILGVRAGFVPAANDRNFQTVIGAKLNRIQTVGTLHGFASRHYNMYDFMHTYSGKEMLSVDRYGLWSDWWLEYYKKHSHAYRGNQLFVAGPMRPFIHKEGVLPEIQEGQDQCLRVLFVSEIVAVPSEVVPYLEALLDEKDICVYIKFRITGDTFEAWLKKNRPELLSRIPEERILKDRMSDAIRSVHVVVGSQSTGVIEATLQDKPFVLFNTIKWGDYFDVRSFAGEYEFFAESPRDFIRMVRQIRSVPRQTIRNIRDKFFGDSTKNGSVWAVDQLEDILQEG